MTPPTLPEQLLEEIRRLEKERVNDTELENLREFYAQMRKEGLALKRSYGIPPIDTIGKTAYHSGKARR